MITSRVITRTQHTEELETLGFHFATYTYQCMVHTNQHASTSECPLFGGCPLVGGFGLFAIIYSHHYGNFTIASEYPLYRGFCSLVGGFINGGSTVYSIIASRK